MNRLLWPTMIKPDIEKKIIRNLERIKEMDLILDYNMRALAKGAKEPYICRSILERVREMGIKIAPGEDSHSIDDIEAYIHQGIGHLSEMGFDLNWPTPRLLKHSPSKAQK